MYAAPVDEELPKGIGRSDKLSVIRQNRYFS